MVEFIGLSVGILLQILFCAFLAGSSTIIARQLLPKRDIVEQVCASGVIFFWFASLIFNILINLKLFYPIPALALSATVFLVVYRKTPEKQYLLNFWNKLFKFSGIVFRLCNKSMTGATFTFVAFACLLLTRSMLLPMISWDSLAYHTLKANLWVQSACHYTLESPGLWESYRTFFGGGEAFTALAMVFTRNDLFGSIPDFLLWLLMGFMVYSIARELSIKSSSALLLSAAFLTTPVLTNVVGSGYVDNGMSTFLLAGILFFLKLLKTEKPCYLFLSAASYGLAGSIKLNGLAISLIMITFLMIMTKIRNIASTKQIALALILFACPVVPWLWFNYQVSGFILGSAPAKLGSLVLGKMPLSLEYFFSDPDIQAYSFQPELKSLVQALSSTGLFSIILFLAVLGTLIQIKKRETKHWIAIIQICAGLALYFSPSFSVIRLLWADSNCRFIISSIILLIAVGFRPVSRITTIKKAISSVCLLSIMTSFLYYICRFIFFSNQVIELPLLVAAIVLSGSVYLTLKKTPSTMKLSSTKKLLALFFLLFCLPLLGTIKSSIKGEAYENSVFFHDCPKYWTGALARINGKKDLSIAFSYGMNKLYHKAFIAPFFGEQLQNKISYVSPLTNGKTPIYHPDYINKESYSYESWFKRLQDAKITHLLCFAPICQELSWAKNHPESFIQLENSKEWGFFELK
ncbi:MAG: glycosyltransferase family 39 protein [Candidatus Riflebacteria bacterium]|nr:glycosyltransferase family 39 protein [Candidatus Riflebacteria bacterium]